jgi:transcriptional repressor NrdR
VAELSFPYIIKRDGRRTPFSPDKLRMSFMKALEKRNISLEKIEMAIVHIQRKLLAGTEREVGSAQLGEWVMHQLLHLDQVAYIRFASVYQSFSDLEAFRKAIQTLHERGKSDGCD